MSTQRITTWGYLLPGGSGHRLATRGYSQPDLPSFSAPTISATLGISAPAAAASLSLSVPAIAATLGLSTPTVGDG